jgi:uncharacterized tellurite resistance protein B-like protein
MAEPPPQADVNRQLKATLLDALREFFEEHREGATPTQVPRVDRRKIQLAAAALLVQMARADYEVSGEERNAVVSAVWRLLGSSEDEARALVELAEEDQLSIPFRDLVRLVDEHVPVEHKKRLAECLWSVAFADAQILAHEEYLARKICDLIHLSTADLIEAKVKARESLF